MTAHRSPTLRRRHHNRPSDDTPLRRRSRPGWMLVETAAGLGVLLVIMTTFMLATRDWTRAAASSHVKETTTDILNSALAPASTIDCAAEPDHGACVVGGDGVTLPTGHTPCDPPKPPIDRGIPLQFRSDTRWGHLPIVFPAFVWVCIEADDTDPTKDQLTVKWHVLATRQQLEAQTTHPDPSLGRQHVGWSVFSIEAGSLGARPNCQFSASQRGFVQHHQYPGHQLWFNAPGYKGSKPTNGGAVLSSNDYALNGFRSVQTGIPASRYNECAFSVQARDQYNFTFDDPSDPNRNPHCKPNNCHGQPGGRQLVMGAVDLRVNEAKACGGPGDPDPSLRRTGICVPQTGPNNPNAADVCPDDPNVSAADLASSPAGSMRDRLVREGKDVLYCAYVYDWHEFGDLPDGPDTDTEPDKAEPDRNDECRGLDDFKAYSMRQTLVLAYTIEQPDHPFRVEGSVRREALPDGTAWTARPGGDLGGYRATLQGSMPIATGWLSEATIGTYPELYGQGPSSLSAPLGHTKKPFDVPPVEGGDAELEWRPNPTKAWWPNWNVGPNIHPPACVPIVGDIGVAVTWCTDKSARRDIECEAYANKWVTPFWLASPGWNEPPDPLTAASP